MGGKMRRGMMSPISSNDLLRVASHLLGGGRVRHHWTVHSYFSAIASVQNGAEPMVVKHIDLSERPGTSPSAVAADIAEYYKVLEASGVKVPRQHGVHLIDGEVYELMEDVGYDAAVEIHAAVCEGDPEKVAAILAAIMESIAPVLTQEENGIFESESTRECFCPIGLDARLSNFSTDGHFLDFHPSHFMRADGTWSVFCPQPKSVEDMIHHLRRKYRPVPALRRFVCYLLMIDRGLWNSFNEAMDRVLGTKTAANLRDGLSRTFLGQVMAMTPRQVIEALDSLTADDIDELRECAIMVLPNGPDRRKRMQEVHCLTRRDMSPGYEIPQPERVELLKRFLIQETNK